ncbi:MAG TPA: tetratricopeptide repeat protein [Phycisphaerae bacterium]|nr:tetratricopeptide repeat protein [Phycisphaerae bacterium]
MSKAMSRMRRAAFGALVLGLLLGGLSGCSQDKKDLKVQAVEQFRGQQYVESMATLRQVFEMDRSDAEANYYMGLNHQAMAARRFRDGNVVAACRELDTAVLYFRAAVKSWPNYMAAINAQNESLEARGRYEQALAVARNATEVNRGVSEHFIVLGNEYRERGDYDNALKGYKTALSIDPNSAVAYAEMGTLYARVGDRALAIDSLKRSYELNPRQTGVADQIARLGATTDARIASDEVASPPPPAVEQPQ